MAITSEIIGKLGGGGAEVEVTPVSGASSGNTGAEAILRTVQVPAGESWLIAVIGDMTASSLTQYNSPDLMLGNIKTNRYNTQDRMAVAGVHTGTVAVKLVRRYHTGTDSFTGHVYTVKM